MQKREKSLKHRSFILLGTSYYLVLTSDTHSNRFSWTSKTEKKKNKLLWYGHCTVMVIYITAEKHIIIYADAIGIPRDIETTIAIA